MVLKSKIFIIGLTIIFIGNKVACSHVRFTNVVCTSLDPTFAITENCKLIAVSRGLKYFSLKAKILQVPVNDFELRVQVMKKANGWKPFLYDVTLKCNFTRHLNALTRLVWNIVRQHTNVKHDCPYNQNLEMEKLNNTIVENAIMRLPVPAGEYAFFTTWKTLNKTRYILNLYGAVI